MTNKTNHKAGKRLHHKSTAGVFKSLLENNMTIGISVLKIRKNKKGHPIDFIIVDANNVFCKITDNKAGDIVGKGISNIFTGVKKDEIDWIKICKKSAATGKSTTAEVYLEKRRKWFKIRVHSLQDDFIVTEIFEKNEINKSGEIFFEIDLGRLNLIETITDGFVSLDRNWCYKYMNKRAGEIFGRDPVKIVGKHIWTEFPEGIGQPFHRAYERAMKTGKFIQLEEYYPPYEKWFENRIYPTKDGISIFFQDITDRKKAQINLEKMIRTYSFISRINQMIVRAKSPEEIFRSACRIAVKYGKIKMVWIGLIDKKAKQVKPFCKSGYEKGYLKEMNKILLNNKTLNKGPTASSILKGEYVVCGDIATDPIMNPWKESALKRGYKSSIALPLGLKGNIFGSISLYSDVLNFFDSQEIELLIEVAENISYAIEALKSEEIRKKSEAELKENESFLASVIENIPNMLFIKDAKELKFVRFNKAGEKLLGLKRSKLIGKNDYDFFPKDQADCFIEADRSVLTTGTVKDIPIEEISTKSGKRLLHTKKIPIKNRSGKPKYLLGISEDITEKIQSDKSLTELNKLYYNLFYNSFDPILLTHPDGGIFSANPAACKLFGRNEEEIIKIGRNGLIDPEDKRLSHLVKRRNEEGFAIGELTFVKKDGT